VTDSGIEAAFAFTEAQFEGPNAIVAAFGAVVRQFGFDRFIVTGLPRPSAELDPLVLANAWPGGWYERYSQLRYFDRDPVGLFALQTALPFRWRDVPGIFHAERRSKALMGEAQEFGLADGYCVPLISPAGLRAVVALSSRSPTSLSSRECAALHILAVAAYGRLVALRANAPQPPRRLSTREREVMTWTAVGKSAWEISQILGLSERTVVAHLANVRTLLSAVNTVQAVVTCIRLGEIQPH
jgi:LuxR family transcriptional regulator, quorum-sensing system regulator BjaR1